MHRTFLAVTIVLVIGLLSAVPLMVKAQSSDPTQITIYAGEVSTSQYGFGNTATSITSPGPTITLKEGTTYTVTCDNVGTMPHAWEISSTKAITSSPMFGAGIDITSYIAPGSSGSVTFTPNKTGNFYYVCTVPGHIALGMWGSLVVTSSSTSASPTIPEFPSVLALMFVALAAAGFAAYLAKQKLQIKPL